MHMATAEQRDSRQDGARLSRDRWEPKAVYFMC